MKINKTLKNILIAVILLLILGYFALKAFTVGNDINVYLHAAQQIFNGENIYKNNPYNNYLYSPLFALLLQPIAHINWTISRFIWLVINALIVYRLWILLIKFIKPNTLKLEKRLHLLAIGVIIISLGFINHNLVLGQVTILILWLTIEGIYQIMLKKNVKGAILLALGINIKIIPVIALGYLFLKRKFLAIGLILFFLIVSIVLPIPFIGYDYNIELLKNWEQTINPENEKFVFEDNNGCQSLNCILRAYFTETGSHTQKYGLKRQIADISFESLEIILKSLRILLVLSVIPIVFYRYKKRKFNKLWWFWEISYLMLVSLLIFPHQMKYTMLYFVPSGAYMILYCIIRYKHKDKFNIREMIIAVISLLLMFIISISGRDIVGNYIVDIIDFYHFWGLTNIMFILLLIICPPTKIENKLNL